MPHLVLLVGRQHPERARVNPSGAAAPLSGVIVGRANELARIDAAVAGARIGRSGVLLLTGEAGIGKSRLLEHALARTDDMLVLRASGSAHDRDVAYGGLLQLLRPALGSVPRIPAPQAAALQVALALRSGPPADRFAVGAATLSLLSVLSEDRPVAVLVDDAHDIDQPSADAIVFAARRLLADAVLVMMAARTGTLSAGTVAGLPSIALTGIDPVAVRALADAVADHPPSTAVVQRIHDLSAGNPLAVIELARHGFAATPATPGAPSPVPAALAARFGRRAETLSAAGRSALRIVATAGSELALVAKVCAASGVAVRALAEAERAGLLRLDADTATFLHPLMRAGVYAAIAPDERRRLHTAVAEELPADDDRRVWHRCEAAIGPDADCAAAIAGVAARAAARGAHALAGVAFERAARLCPEADGRAEYFLAAARAGWDAGDADRATALLATDSGIDRSPLLRAGAQELAGTVAARCGSLIEARSILLGAAGETAALDADRALLLYAEVIHVCFYLGDAGTAGVAVAAAEKLLDPAATRPAQLIAAIATGVGRIMVGQDGAARIRRAVQRLADLDDVGPDVGLGTTSSAWTLLGPMFLRETGTGRGPARQVLDDGRARAAVGTLPHLLFHIARVGATTDRWASAAADYTEGITLAREFGQTTELAAGLAGLAWLEARMGRDTDCRAHVAEAMTLSADHHIHLGRAWAQFALGDLQLASGRADQAAVSFSALARWLDDNRILDPDLSPLPELVEALLRSGSASQAVPAAIIFAERATAKGQPWSLARAERVHGLLADPDALDRHFTAALALHARTPDDFETARTHLAYGSRLRRLRRRIDARPQLRAALEIFEHLGAQPWAETALGELRATGENAHRRSTGDIVALTPQEIQIALLLADGRTTREAGTALFLSPKTVEYHLRHVYTKLGIHSRSELAERMRDVAR